jgi:hypothetical protein
MILIRLDGRTCRFAGLVALALGVAAPLGCGAAAQSSQVSMVTTASTASPMAQTEAKGLRSPVPGQKASSDEGGEARERMIIKVASLDIVTDEPREAFQKAVSLARQLGGYTLSSNHSGSRSSVTLRIPAARFEEALCKLAGLGKVSRREVSGTDVTAEFVDLSIRLRNAEKARDRYIELLAKAASVSEALQVERELERITTLIEQLRGQTNLIKNQVSLSTVNLTLDTPTRPGPLGWVFYGLYHVVRWLFIWN